MFNIFPAYFMYKEEEECLHYVYKCYCSPCEQLSLSVQSEHLALHCLTLELTHCMMTCKPFNKHFTGLLLILQKETF